MRRKKGTASLNFNSEIWFEQLFLETSLYHQLCSAGCLIAAGDKKACTGGRNMEGVNQI